MFKKGEGSQMLRITDIVAEDAQTKFERQLRLLNKLNTETKNNTAWCQIGENKFPNVSYAFSATSLKQVEEGIAIMTREFISQLKEKDVVSFRQPVDIEEYTDAYMVSFRAATITL